MSSSESKEFLPPPPLPLQYPPSQASYMGILQQISMLLTELKHREQERMGGEERYMRLHGKLKRAESIIDVLINHIGGEFRIPRELLEQNELTSFTITCDNLTQEYVLESAKNEGISYASTDDKRE